MPIPVASVHGRSLLAIATRLHPVIDLPHPVAVVWCMGPAVGGPSGGHRGTRLRVRLLALRDLSIGRGEMLLEREAVCRRRRRGLELLAELRLRVPSPHERGTGRALLRDGVVDRRRGLRDLSLLCLSHAARGSQRSSTSRSWSCLKGLDR